jgi:hypothetical protein
MKCIIYGCENTTHQGVFVENLCAPCYEYLSGGNGSHSQARRNEIQILLLRQSISKGEHIDESNPFC